MTIDQLYLGWTEPVHLWSSGLPLAELDQSYPGIHLRYYFDSTANPINDDSSIHEYTGNLLNMLTFLVDIMYVRMCVECSLSNLIQFDSTVRSNYSLYVFIIHVLDVV